MLIHFSANGVGLAGGDAGRRLLPCYVFKAIATSFITLAQPPLSFPHPRGSEASKQGTSTTYTHLGTTDIFVSRLFFTRSFLYRYRW